MQHDHIVDGYTSISLGGLFMSKKTYFLFLCYILSVILFVGCSIDTSQIEENSVHIEPSNLFQGDTERLKPHLGIIGGLVKVSISGSNKSIFTRYEIWENGELKSSHASFSTPVKNNFNGEVSVSLKDDIENNDLFRVTIVISHANGYGASEFTIPKFSRDLSFGPNELRKAIDIKEGEEVAVWSLLAQSKGRSFFCGDIEESAKKADWAFVLKVSVKDNQDNKE